MHELSIASAVADIARRNAGEVAVEKVRLRVGQLRQVVPTALEGCWELVAAGTSLEGSVLDLTVVPAVLRCRRCDETTLLELPIFRCGSCGSSDVDVQQGDELLVESLDLAEARAKP